METHLTSPGSRHFVIAGMPRAGTTFLYHAFATHPDAFVPYRKELRFFSANHHRGTGWYSRFFSRGAANLLRVDASPDYFMDRAAPARIREFSSDIKVVLAVRDPARWAVSLHRQLATFERVVPAFRDFLVEAEYPDFVFSWGKRTSKLKFSLQSGFVQSQLAAFRNALGPQLLLYDFAQFERDPVPMMQAIECFLGIRAFFSKDNLPAGRINSRSRKSNHWLSYLTSRDVLINAAGAIIPRKVLVAFRMKMDRTSILGHRPTAFDNIDACDLALARKALATDVRYVNSLFAKSPLVLGNGRIFSEPSGSPA